LRGRHHRSPPYICALHFDCRGMPITSNSTAIEVKFPTSSHFVSALKLRV
jgi:hypothetical protein